MYKNTYPPILTEIGAFERDDTGTYCVIDDYLFCSSKGLVIWDLVSLKKIYTNSSFGRRILFAYYKDKIMLIWNQNKLYFFNYKTFTYSVYKEIKKDFTSIMMITPSILILSSRTEIYVLNLVYNSSTHFQYREGKKTSSFFTTLIKLSDELIVVIYKSVHYVIDWKQQKVVNIFGFTFHRICLIDKRNGQLYMYPFIPDTDELLIIPFMSFDQFFPLSLLPAIREKSLFEKHLQMCMIKDSNYCVENDFCNLIFYTTDDRTPYFYKHFRFTRLNIFFSTSKYLMQETQIDDKVRIYNEIYY